jgi:hypothetical protein
MAPAVFGAIASVALFDIGCSAIVKKQSWSTGFGLNDSRFTESTLEQYHVRVVVDEHNIVRVVLVDHLLDLVVDLNS